jgi:hypothetical protein
VSAQAIIAVVKTQTPGVEEHFLHYVHCEEAIAHRQNEYARFAIASFLSNDMVEK